LTETATISHAVNLEGISEWKCMGPQAPLGDQS